jgi:UDP-glucose 4-epimerase
MRILITGGFGFVGGRMAKHLQESGHTIILASRQIRQSPEWLPGAEVLRIDWMDDNALEAAARNADIIIHAAGMNSRESQSRPADALAFNGVATARLVTAAEKAGCKKFFYLSTAHVYASPLSGRITEDNCPRNLHPYASSHRAGEDAVRFSCGTHPGYVVLRLSNGFGYPMHRDADCWTLLVNELCLQAVTTRQLVLHTAGTQERDFIPLSDVCSLLNILVNTDEHRLPGIINVCSSRAMRVIDMAKLVAARAAAILGYSPDQQFHCRWKARDLLQLLSGLPITYRPK